MKKSNSVVGLSETLSLVTLPQIGKTLKLNTVPAIGVMAGASQVYPGHKVTLQGVVYELGIKNNLVKYIFTNDRHFVDSANLTVESSLADALKQAQGELKREAGWGYFVLLKSGWYAGFTYGHTLTEVSETKVPHSTKVKWFFKR